MKKLLPLLFLCLATFSLSASPVFAAYGLTKSANFVSASTQYLNRATNLGVATNITMETWIRVASAPASGSAKAMMGVRGTTGKNVYALEYANNAGTLQFQVRANQDNIVSNTYVFTKTFTVGTWYHVSMTNDGTTVKGQIDHVEVISTAYPGAGSGAPPQEFRIGAHPWDEVGKWDGDISLARVWSTALSNDTIDANKCTVYGGAQANMLGEWSLDNVLTDAGGSGFTLTNNGVVTFTSTVPSTCTTVPATFKFWQFFDF
jgi:hypothetical protein